MCAACWPELQNWQQVHDVEKCCTQSSCWHQAWSVDRLARRSTAILVLHSPAHQPLMSSRCVHCAAPGSCSAGAVFLCEPCALFKSGTVASVSYVLCPRQPLLELTEAAAAYFAPPSLVLSWVFGEVNSLLWLWPCNSHIPFQPQYCARDSAQPLPINCAASRHCKPAGRTDLQVHLLALLQVVAEPGALAAAA